MCQKPEKGLNLDSRILKYLTGRQIDGVRFLFGNFSKVCR